MDVTTSTDAVAFAALAAPVIEAEPILHSVLASVLADAAAGHYPGYAFYAVQRPGRPPALAHHTPPFPFHVPAPDAEAAAALARHVWAEGRRPDAVGGHLASVESFAAEWTRLSGLRAEVRMRLGLYDLPVPVRLPWPVSGRPRAASDADLALVDDWNTAFYREALGQEPPPSDRARTGIAGQRVLLWCDPDPVAMARARPAVGGVARVGGVYTPPEHRGRGYGSAVTAAVSAEVQDAGQRCMLYTDLANPTSNGIYRAMGYRHLMDTAEVTFASGSVLR